MNVYLVVILFILVAKYLLDSIEDILNARHVSDVLPSEFEGYYDADKYRKSQQYLKVCTHFGLLTATFMTIVMVVFIVVGGFNAIDNLANQFGYGSIATGLIFAGIIIVGLQILGLPFSIYSTFVIEEKFGFNKTTPTTFITDILKSMLLLVLIGAPVFAMILWFFENYVSYAWLYCWLAVTAFQIVMYFLAPYVIMPLFNKFQPLEEGELKNAIEQYASDQNFAMKGIFKMDGSRRSAKSNAFFTGFGKSRRIVLFDTLIEKHTVPELVAIIAHEMGHYRKKHIFQAIIRSVIHSGLMFFLLSLFINNRGLFLAFKMERPPSIYASLFFFALLYTPIETVLAIIENIISRKHEFEADAFSVQTYGNINDMITALKKLSVDNLSNLTPHPMKVFLSYSHPPVLERIAAIRNIAGSNLERELEA